MGKKNHNLKQHRIYKELLFKSTPKKTKKPLHLKIKDLKLYWQRAKTRLFIRNSDKCFKRYTIDDFEVTYASTTNILELFSIIF